MVRFPDPFDLELTSKFPEIVADFRAVAKGRPPKGELYVRAREIFRDSVAKEPQLWDNGDALLAACHQARAELAIHAAHRCEAAETEELSAPQTPSAQRTNQPLT